MNQISKSALKIIIKGAVKMAQQDSQVVDEEEGLIKKLIDTAEIDSEEFLDLKAPMAEDMEVLCNQLSSDRAKKVFLLTMVAVANVDDDFDSTEREFLDSLSESLQVGKVRLDQQTIEACEKEVIKLLAEHQ